MFKSLTIEADESVGDEEHEDDDNAPAEDLGHPSSVMEAISGILLILDPHHEKGQHGEKEEIPQAYPKHRIGLEPLPIRRPLEMIDP